GGDDGGLGRVDIDLVADQGREVWRVPPLLNGPTRVRLLPGADRDAFPEGEYRVRLRHRGGVQRTYNLRVAVERGDLDPLVCAETTSVTSDFVFNDAAYSASPVPRGNLVPPSGAPQPL